MFGRSKNKTVKLYPEMIIEEGKFERFGNTFKFKVNYQSAEAVANNIEDAIMSVLRLKHEEISSYREIKKGNNLS